MDVCAGGTISTTTSSITFVNHHSQPCDLGSCTYRDGRNPTLWSQPRQMGWQAP